MLQKKPPVVSMPAVSSALKPVIEVPETVAMPLNGLLVSVRARQVMPSRFSCQENFMTLILTDVMFGSVPVNELYLISHGRVSLRAVAVFLVQVPMAASVTLPSLSGVNLAKVCLSKVPSSVMGHDVSLPPASSLSGFQTILKPFSQFVNSRFLAEAALTVRPRAAVAASAMIR